MTEAELFEKLEPWAGVVPRGYWANWLGAKIGVPFHAHWMPHDRMAHILKEDRFEQTRRPVFGDGESFFEQANTIRSVLAANERYIMVELGGGNGPRAVDCGIALKKLKPSVAPFLVVVEGLPTYVEWCKHHFRINGFDPDQNWIVEGVISSKSAPIPFYLQPRGFGNQAQDPSVEEILIRVASNNNSTAALLSGLLRTGVLVRDDELISAAARKPVSINGFEDWTVDQLVQQTVQVSTEAEIGFVSTFTLETILAPLPHVDFMDVDIQHMEEFVIPPCIKLLRRKVKLLSVGTHRKDIHIMLLNMFKEAGWTVIYNIEPYGVHQKDGMEFANHDGVLTVQNPDF